MRIKTFVVAVIAGVSLMGCSHSRAVHAAPTATVVAVAQLDPVCIPGSSSECDTFGASVLSALGERLVGAPTVVEYPEVVAAR